MGPYILHIETSTKICSVALSDGMECIAVAEDSNGDHTLVLNDLIRAVMTKANIKLKQLHAISVNEGPGSYTALRIGVVTAKGISYALDKPLILVSGLKMIARAARDLMPGFQYYVSMIDARRDEVYMAVYNEDLVQSRPPEAVILNNELLSSLGLTNNQCVITGNGALKWGQYIDNWQPKLVNLNISAIQMIPLAYEQFEANDFTKTELAIPFYLKLPNITTPNEKFITR